MEELPWKQNLCHHAFIFFLVKLLHSELFATYDDALFS